MTERPILFSEGMVRAILAGQKTQTRRIATQKHLPVLDVMSDSYIKNRQDEWQKHCPYFNSLLWVRETWATEQSLDAKPASTFAGWPIWYAADNSVNRCGSFLAPRQRGKTRPSIFMPRWASRILLKTVNIRVERLQDISHADAMREGWPETTPEKIAMAEAMGDGDDAAIEWFANLWDSINAKHGCSWESNPWVWVVEFRREGVR